MCKRCCRVVQTGELRRSSAGGFLCRDRVKCDALRGALRAAARGEGKRIGEAVNELLEAWRPRT